MTDPTPRRPSPAVYRRRRLVALLGLILVLVVVVAIIWTLVAQPWRGSSTAATPTPSATAPSPAASTPAPSDTPTAAPTPTTTPQTDPTAVAAPACTTGDLTVQAVTDQGEYGADQNPQLSISLTNRGAKDCTVNVGTSTQAFTITSGSDTWWRSTDCQSAPSDMVVTLAAGQTVASAAPLTWDRTRSSVSTCDSPDRDRAAGGGATYHLAVSIGGVPSAQTTSFILD